MLNSYADGYHLDVSTSSAFSSFVSGYQDLDVGNVLNQSVAGLAAGTTHYYRVRAYNSAGTSANSSTIAATTAANLPPPPKPASSTQILLQDESGFLAAWLMNGPKVESGSMLDPSNAGSGWRVCGTGDFSADGKDDVLFQHADGSLAVWFMDGIKMNSATLLTPPSSGSDWRVAAVGDFNRDGKTDVALQHTDGKLAAWLMDGSRLTQGLYFEPRNPGDAQWKVVGSGDLENRGAEINVD